MQKTRSIHFRQGSLLVFAFLKRHVHRGAYQGSSRRAPAALAQNTHISAAAASGLSVTPFISTLSSSAEMQLPHL